jgi:hypothetical protein
MAEELGRQLVELRRGSRVVGIILVTFALALTGGLVYLAITKDAAALGGVFFPLMFFAIGWWGLRHRLVIYEHGFEVFGFVGHKRLRYDQVERLAYRTVRQRVNGIPTGTYVYATVSGAGKSAVFNLRIGQQETEALEPFRSRLTSEIAKRSLARLQGGESVPWGPHARLAPDGLYYRPKAFISRRPEQRADYNSSLRYAIAYGSCTIFPAESSPDRHKELITLSCDAPNFFPGLALLCHLGDAKAL